MKSNKLLDFSEKWGCTFVGWDIQLRYIRKGENMDTIHYINGERQVRVRKLTDLQRDKPKRESPTDHNRAARVELYRVRHSAGLDIFTGHID